MIRPLTPKGVEHCSKTDMCPENFSVIRPLTPKGVEHIYKNDMGWFVSCDPSSDAERR